MPVTPMAERASRTSSSLNGLMIAVTSFMVSPVCERSERIRDEPDEAAFRPVLALHGVEVVLGVGVLVVRADVEAVPEVVAGTGLPYRVGERAVVLVRLVRERARERELLVARDRVRDVGLDVIGALAVGDAERVVERVRVLDVQPLPRDARVHLIGVRLRVEGARARVL